MPTPPPLGPLIRLRALSPSDVPAHPDLASIQTASSSPPLHTFIASALTEAETFMTTYLPREFKSKGTKSSAPSAAGVELLARDIAASELLTEVRAGGGSDEAWFARTSVHENAEREGTASWGEFGDGLCRQHSRHEMEYTPDVFDAHQVLSWDRWLVEEGGLLEGWTDVGMSGEFAHACLLFLITEL